MSIHSFKTELNPNNVQTTLLAKNAGCARFAYNWGLGLLKENYEKRKQDEEANVLKRKYAKI